MFKSPDTLASTFPFVLICIAFWVLSSTKPFCFMPDSVESSTPTAAPSIVISPPAASATEFSIADTPLTEPFVIFPVVDMAKSSSATMFPSLLLCARVIPPSPAVAVTSEPLITPSIFRLLLPLTLVVPVPVMSAFSLTSMFAPLTSTFAPEIVP